MDDLPCGQGMHDPDARVALADQAAGGHGQLRGAPPGRVVVAHLVPAGCLKARVVGGAVVIIGEADRAGHVGLPAAVGGVEYLAAVLQAHVQQAPEAQLVAQVAAHVRPAGNRAAVPAVSQGHAHGVFAPVHEVCHVPGLVLQAVVIGCPAGREHLVRDLFSVDGQGIDAQRGGIRPGADHLAANLELLAQADGRLQDRTGVLARADKPAGGRTGGHQAGVPEGLLRIIAVLPLFVPHAHAPVIPAARLKCGAFVGDQVIGAGRDLSAVPEGRVHALAEDLNAIGRLRRGGVLELPAEARTKVVQPQRVFAILTAKIHSLKHFDSSFPVGRQGRLPLAAGRQGRRPLAAAGSIDDHWPP